MNTPIIDFVKKYNEEAPMRLHMPGHKGATLVGGEAFDITEIDGADVLYSPTGIILESERNAQKLFGTARTVYSTEGSSLSIRAMLYLSMLYGKTVGKDTTIVAARNVHKSFVSACALLDIDVEWLFGNEDDRLLSCLVTKEELTNKLETLRSNGKEPFAVYITSPDYLGNILDVEGLSEVCHKNGTLLLVDNAHGAYLKFLSPSRHPIDLGADLCADSAHKTLPALTGAGYLHVSKNAPMMITESADRAMSLFASTSPSYLILGSLDATNAYITNGYAKKLNDLCKKLGVLKKELREHGYTLLGDEKLKLTIDTRTYGYNGYELADILKENGIICEHSDKDTCVMMLTPETATGIERLRSVLLSVKKLAPIRRVPPKKNVPVKKTSIREAVLSPSYTLPVSECLGKISGDTAVTCPPAIPITMSGEVIDSATIDLFKYYGIEKCSVLQEKNSSLHKNMYKNS